MATIADADRYLRIVRWLRQRYTRADGVLIVERGGKPTTYKRIEYMAFRRYVA